MFQVGKGLGHENRPGKQYHGQRRLHDDQRFLRQGRTVPGGAVGPAQRLGRLRMRRQPRRRRAKEHAGRQRDQKGKAQHGQRRTSLNGQILGVGKDEVENRARTGIGDGQAGESAQATKQHAFGENLAHHAAASRSQAMRTATSARRVVARASIRLAMLAQAISSTKPERIISIFKLVLVYCCRI